MRAAHRPLVTVAVVAMAIVTGCASSSAKAGIPQTSSPSPVATATPTPTAAPTASPTPEPAFSIHEVTANLGPISQNPLWYFAGGHWLYANDLNDTIVYDGKVVAHGHPVTAALSQNGLHYAYTLAKDLSVYVDSRSVATGTYLPDVFAVSDDGSTVLYSDTDGFNGAGTIYRNGAAIFNAPVSIGEAVGSADALHYTAIVDSGRSVASLVHDGRTVATSGITGNTTPIISPDGSHYGMYTTGPGGVTSVDGVSILPAGESGLWGEVTDAGHWVVLDSAEQFAPRVDGMIDGPPAAEAVINDDATEVAVFESRAGLVLVNGRQVVANAPVDTYLNLVDNTLYIYDVVTSH